MNGANLFKVRFVSAAKLLLFTHAVICRIAILDAHSRPQRYTTPASMHRWGFSAITWIK